VKPHAHAESGWTEHMLFLGALVRNPRSVGAIVPSSAYLARDMVRDIAPASRVVELGPGTGVITRAVVRRTGLGGRVLAVDTNRKFVERIQRTWPEVDCVCASAETLPELVAARGWDGVDHIVSGLPFASLPGAVTLLILDAVRDVLRVGGTFTTFQYVPLYRLPPAVAFRRELSARLGSEPRSRLVVRNVPPARILTWHRLS
jgi:phosphatidylethanolamine/phosphatidyl-N-methylethanolamine N-methyltransferase